MFKRTNLKIALTFLLALAPASGLFAQTAQAASIQGVNPEVVARVWVENDQQVASICLNGKELLSFRGDSNGTAADKADLAAKLQDLLENPRFDPEDVLPGRAGTLASMQIDGNSLLSFEASGAISPKGASASALETSWRLVNGIRTAYSAPTVPNTFLKLAERANPNGSSYISGHASWYGGKFHGRKCSDGSRYNQEKLTAAHRSLPFGTKLLVMNRKTGDACVVKVNDRGPFVDDRIIDLSRGAARQLNMLSEGVAVVDCLVLGNE